MTSTVQHSLYGTITYDENFWTGKKEITINGESLIKEKKNVYTYQNGESKIQVVVQGNFIMGVKLVMADQTIEMTEAAKWYEIACSVVLFVFMLTWGSSPSLCAIIPIIGGAIGGAVNGLLAIINLFAMKSVKSVPAKLAIWLAMFVAAFGICFALALAFLEVLA